MQIEPLPKKLYDRAVAAGITEIQLSFSGGSDEGYLSVTLNSGQKHDSAFEEDIENWAWDVYYYSGAGDGNDYGDEITYNLVTMTATHSEWHMERQDGEETDESFGLVDEGDEDGELLSDDSVPLSPIDLLRELARLGAECDYLPPAMRELIEKSKQLTGEDS